MSKIDKLVRDNVRSLTPYSCARDEYDGRTGIFMDANENPFGHLNRYPDPYHRELRSVLSKLKAVPPENIFLGNGSDEIIDLCYRIFCDPGTDRAMIFTPTYGMYEVSASVNDVKVIRVPLNDEFQININEAIQHLKDQRLKLIFICSPNNPSGNCMNERDVELILKNFSGMVVIDEAYSAFSGRASFISRISSHDNLIVLQTFSKAMGMAAIRIGMAFATKEVIRYFFRMKPPYNISAVNQEAALKCLSNMETVDGRVMKIIKERNRLARELAGLDLTETVYPSDANFLLLKVKDADYIYKTLLSNNIIVRNKSRDIKNCLRITTGTRSENDALIRELKKIQI
jgi:histidinol-phosphate aminotransferase